MRSFFRKSRCLLIFPGCILDVHCHIINLLLSDQFLQHTWMGTVRIQFYCQPQFLNFVNKVRKILLNGRFSTGNTDAGQNMFTLFKKTKDILFRVMHLCQRA